MVDIKNQKSEIIIFKTSDKEISENIFIVDKTFGFH